MDHWRVEQELTHCPGHCLGLGLCHTEQHLKLECSRNLADAALSSEQPGVCHVKEVVAGNANVDVVHALRGHGPVQHTLVVGVGLLLGTHHGERPAVHSCFDSLHGQICTLDQADLDCRSPASAAGCRPLLEVLHGSHGIWQVGLQDDPGL